MKLLLTIFTVLLFSLVNFGQSERDKGIALYQANDYDAAILAFQEAVITNQNDRDAWLYLGMSLAQTKRKKEAVKALRKGNSISFKSSIYDTGLKIISKPRCNLTDMARQNRTQGTVRFAVEFGADRKIKAIAPFETLPDGLTQNCMEAVKGIKFDPASKNGNPVSIIKVLEYSFTFF